jgi:phasin family protein
MSQPQPELLELYRAALKGAVDWMKASLEGAERLQNQQLIAIRRALDAYAKTAVEVSEAKSVDELLAVQTRMGGAQAERILGYWTGVYENQMSAMGQLQSQFQQTLSRAREAEAAMRAAVSAARRETTEAR